MQNIQCITHSQQFFGMIVLSPCKRLNQTFHLSTIDIFPMQKGCHMNNLCSLFCHEIFILVPSSFQRAEQYIQVLFGETFVQESRHMMRMRIICHLDEIMQICWSKQIDGIEVEQSNLNFQTSLIIWVALPRFIIESKNGRKLKFISFSLVNFSISMRNSVWQRALFREKLIISLIYSYSDILRSLHTKGRIRWITNTKIVRDFISSTNINWWSN